VKQAAADDNSVAMAKATRSRALLAAGLAKARAVAITFFRYAAALKIFTRYGMRARSFP